MIKKMKLPALFLLPFSVCVNAAATNLLPEPNFLRDLNSPHSTDDVTASAWPNGYWVESFFVGNGQDTFQIADFSALDGTLAQKSTISGQSGIVLLNPVTREFLSIDESGDFFWSLQNSKVVLFFGDSLDYKEKGVKIVGDVYAVTMEINTPFRIYQENLGCNNDNSACSYLITNQVNGNKPLKDLLFAKQMTFGTLWGANDEKHYLNEHRWQIRRTKNEWNEIPLRHIFELGMGQSFDLKWYAKNAYDEKYYPCYADTGNHNTITCNDANHTGDWFSATYANQINYVFKGKQLNTAGFYIYNKPTQRYLESSQDVLRARQVTPTSNNYGYPAIKFGINVHVDEAYTLPSGWKSVNFRAW